MDKERNYWIITLNDKIYNLEIPDLVRNNLKSFYNSKKGIEYSKNSYEFLKKYIPDYINKK